MAEKIDASIAVAAPKRAAWELLADYGNVDNYVGGVVDAHLTTKQTAGVGMTRYCALPRMMMMKQYIVEEISAWDEGKSFTYVVTDTTAPIADGSLEWSVDGDDRRCVIRARGTYRPKGLMGRLMRLILRKQFAKQIDSGLADMKRHLEAPATLRAKAA